MKPYLFILVILSLTCCAKTFERKIELDKFLFQIHNIDSLNNDLVILIDGGVCGACSNENVEQLLTLIQKASLPVTVVQTTDDNQLRNKILALERNTRFIIDDKNVSKWGLSFTEPMILHYVNNNIKFWSSLEERTKQKIFEYFIKV